MEEKKHLVKSNIVKNIMVINDLLFFITFFKFRIYDFYVNVIHNQQYYNVLLKYNKTIFQYLHILFGTHGLYLLNVYWFTIIIKKIYKHEILPLFPAKNVYLLNEIQSKMFFLNIGISSYIYTQLSIFNPIYLLDIAGISVLSYFSYQFHQSKNIFVKKCI
jgi:hypothetical protein